MKGTKMIMSIGIIILILIIISGIIMSKGMERKNMSSNPYRTITSEKAAEMMKNEENYIIIDVRTKEEYESGHIPNSISLPLQEIGQGEVKELPDKGQLIMVYCRSGNRSGQAAERLASKGYTNIVDFGGISSWKGEIRK